MKQKAVMGVYKPCFDALLLPIDRSIHRRGYIVQNTKPLLVFDVIETVFSLSPLADKFMQYGLPAHARDLFFSQLLRDAFATATATSFKPFQDIASGTLQVLLASQGISAGPETVDDILSAFGQLPAHGDVHDALERARDAGAHIVFLTNGSLKNTHKLVIDNQLASLVDDILSIENIGVWKPAKKVYQETLKRTGSDVAKAGMIAAHAWDTQGAANAGFKTGWIRRQDAIYHPGMTAPHCSGERLGDVVSGVLEIMGG